MARKTVATDPQRKAQALQLAKEFGAAEASRRTGIPAGTIRSWGSRPPRGSADTVEPSGTINPGRGAQKSWQVGEAATRKALELIEKGDMLGAQRAMVTAGIAADKTGQLQEAAGRLEDHRDVLLQRFAQNIADLLRLYNSAIGLPGGSEFPGIDVLEELLRSISLTGALAVSPATAERAAAATLDHFRKQVRGELEAEIRAEILVEQKPELPQLSAPSGEGGSSELQANGSHPQGGGAPEPPEIFSGEFPEGVEEVDAVVVVEPRRVRVGAVDHGPELAPRQPSKWRF
jgi:hypothetical protein